MKVIEERPSKNKKYGKECVCLCSCGKKKTVLRTHLIQEVVRSCGHIRQSPRDKNSKNTSGERCISINKKTQKWQTIIRYKNHSYNLGEYEDIEKAIDIRNRSEDILYNWSEIETYQKLFKYMRDEQKIR